MTAVLYRCFDASGAVLYVGVTSQPWQRIAAHRRASPFRAEIDRVDFRWFGSRAQAMDAQAAEIAEHRPPHNWADNPDTPYVGRSGGRSLPPRKPPVKADLAQWVKAQRPKTAKQCSEALGVSQSYLYDMLNGTAQPSLALALRIQSVTGGAVPVSSWPKLRAVLKIWMAAE